MRIRTLTLLLLLVAIFTAHGTATEQEHDVIIYGSEKGELETSFTYPSPLELYYNNAYPFTVLSTANYRGHIATWEVKDGKLYLAGVRVGYVDIPLDWLFAVPANAPRVEATWFSGVLLGFFGSFKEWHSNPNYPGNYYVTKYAANVFFEVQNGQVLNESVLTDAEYWAATGIKTKNPVQTTPEYKAAVEKYYSYIDSIEYKDPEMTPVQQTPPPSTTPLGKLLDTLSRRPLVEKVDESGKAGWLMSRDSAGFDTLREAFTIEQATLGRINSFPESLFVRMFTSAKGLMNSVWWWNPIENDRPRYDWNDFLKLYAEASAVVSKHTWLHEWRDVSPGRKIELQAFGYQIGKMNSEIQNSVLPAWLQAGFKGEPAYSILARSSDKEWAQIYFGKDDPRALVTRVSTATSFSSLFGGEAKPKPIPTGHWLDGLDVSFHPRCKPGQPSERYVVVEPSGAYEVKTFKGCSP